MIEMPEGIETELGEDHVPECSLRIGDEILHMDSGHCWCEPEFVPLVDPINGEVAGFYVRHNLTQH